MYAEKPYEVTLVWGDPGPVFGTFDEALVEYKSRKNAVGIVDNRNVDGAPDAGARGHTGLSSAEYERFVEEA